MRLVKARTAVLAATATVAVAAVAFGAGGGGDRRLANAVWDADAGKPEPVQAHRRRAR